MAPGASVSAWRFSASSEQIPNAPPGTAVGATEEPTPSCENTGGTPGPFSESSGPSEDDFDYETICDGSSAAEKIPSIFMGPDLDVFQNPKTKSLHSRAKGATGKLTCGRSVQGMKPFNGKVFSRHWKCKQCMSSKPIRECQPFLRKCKTSDPCLCRANEGLCEQS